MRYRKRPLEIEAVQWSGSNWHEVYDFAGHQVYAALFEGIQVLVVKTLDSEGKCNPGDWVIKGTKGEFYPCRDDIFQETYEAVESWDE